VSRTANNTQATEETSLPDEAAALLLNWHEQPDDPELHAEIEAWRARGPDHERAWTSAQRFWGNLGHIGANHPVFAARETGRVSLFRPRRNRWAAAGLAIAACASTAVWLPELRMSLISDYRTGAGENLSLTLKDGTGVTLDAQSAIKVADDGRGVTLVAGRAFFNVVHNDAAPFTVTADTVKVVDIGTQFDVALRPDTVGVALAEGIVDISWPHGERRLAQPGQALTYDRRPGRPHLKTGPADAVAAWRQGKLLVEDVSLGEAVDQLRPYYKGIIIVTSKRLAAQRVTGVFDINDPQWALQTLINPHEGRLRRISPWIMVIS